MSPSIYVKIEGTIFASIVFATPMSADIIKLSNGFMAGVKKIFTRPEFVEHMCCLVACSTRTHRDMTGDVHGAHARVLSPRYFVRVL